MAVAQILQGVTHQQYVPTPLCVRFIKVYAVIRSQKFYLKYMQFIATCNAAGRYTPTVRSDSSMCTFYQGICLNQVTKILSKASAVYSS